MLSRVEHEKNYNLGARYLYTQQHTCELETLFRFHTKTIHVHVYTKQMKHICIKNISFTKFLKVSKQSNSLYTTKIYRLAQEIVVLGYCKSGKGDVH